jgi:ACT domain.
VLRLSALRGLFSAVIEDPVTFVNAPGAGRGTRRAADISTATESPNHRSVVDVRAVYVRRFGGQRRRRAVGAAAGREDRPDQRPQLRSARRRRVSDRQLLRPAGTLGKIGTLLGAADINIHAAQLSEDAEGPGATILLRIERDVPADVRAAIAEAVGAKLLEVVNLT